MQFNKVFRLFGFKMQVIFDTGIRRHQYCIRIHFGRGAGYIGGHTAYFGVNCVDTAPQRMYWTKPIQLGLTRNANNVPYCNHF